MNLDILHSNEEKLAFLLNTKKEIRRIITCFEKPKLIDLRHYVRDDMILDDNCDELKHFLRRVIMRYSLDSRDRRFPSTDTLKREMKKEVIKYESLDNLLDFEINFIKSEKKKEQSNVGNQSS